MTRRLVAESCPWPKQFRDEEEIVAMVKPFLTRFDWVGYDTLKAADAASGIEYDYDRAAPHHRMLAGGIGEPLRQLFRVEYGGKRGYLRNWNWNETAVQCLI